MIGLGTIVNAAGIVVGGLVGLFFGNLLKEKQQDSLNKACGLSVIFISIAGAMEGMLSVENGMLTSGKAMFIAVSLALGTLIGEILDLEALMEKFGEWLKTHTGNSGDNNFVNAFVTASFTVCIGAMAIVGAIQDGLTGDHTMLFVKSLLDCIIIVVMTASMGKGCMFAAIPVAVFEGAITLLARSVSSVLTDEMIGAISLVGSLLIFCVGVNLVWGKKFRVANMLPAIIIAIIAVNYIS
jgi:uncharacterized membrane protein YqgA involved in biofilm formation